MSSLWTPNRRIIRPAAPAVITRRGLLTGAAAAAASLLLPRPALAAFAIIGSTSAKQGATSVAFNSTGANLLVMACAMFTGNTRPPAITDSAGNTWPAPFLSSTGTTSGNGQFGYMLAMPAPATSATHTWTVSGGASSFALVAVSGAAASSPVDQHTFTVFNAGGITSETPGSVTPTQSNELCVAAYAIDTPAGSTFSVSGGYTIQQQIDVVANNYFGIVLATLIQTTATATNPALTRSALTGGDVAMIGTFKAAGGGTTTVPTRSLMGVGL